jgi:hypothetical protein
MFKPASNILVALLVLVAFTGQAMAMHISTPEISQITVNTAEISQPSSNDTAQTDDCCDVECCEAQCICPSNACSSVPYLQTLTHSPHTFSISELVVMPFVLAPNAITSYLYRPPIFKA